MEKIKVFGYCAGFHGISLNGVDINGSTIDNFDLYLIKSKSKNNKKVYKIPHPDKPGQFMKTPDTRLTIRIEHDLETDKVDWFQIYH